MSQLDEKGRCCGRKPIFYKGGSWASPLEAPMYLCTRCDREFGPDGKQRDSRAWGLCGDCGCWARKAYGQKVAYCGECSVEQDCAP
jgi:hypothetical protein